MADQKWAADERKLASAYDDLFLGRHKAVQNAMDKVLKKNPNSQAALVLRLRLQLAINSPENKIIEGFEKVKSTGELSSQSAWHVAYVMKQVNRLDILMDMYRKLWEDSPDRLEYGNEVFMTALAIWDVPTIATTTRKLFNATRNPVWAQRAAWAEWIANGPQPTSENPFPAPLSDPKPLMTAKILLTTSKSTSATSDFLWLRLQILIASGTLKQALEVATEDVTGASLARQWYRMQAVPVILKHIGDSAADAWSKEWDWVVEKLQNGPEANRNYAFYRYLMLCTKVCDNATQKHDATVKVLRDLNSSIGEKERSPLLAILELDKTAEAEVKMSGKDWLKDVESYWARWGSKGPVVSELEGVLEGDEAKTALIVKLLEERSQSSHSDLQAYREVANSTLFLLRRKSAEWHPQEEDIKRLWDLYLSGLAYGRNLPTTDIQYSDDIGLAAVHLLLIQWSRKKNDETPLFRAIICTRYIISKSPSSTLAKCLLTRIARLAGATQLIPEEFFEEKGPTEVQLDTVSHLAIEKSAGEAHLKTVHSGWQSVIDAASRMHQKTAIDVPDWTKQGILKGSYAKVPSMRSLSYQLSHSLFSASEQIEDARHALMTDRPFPANSSKRLLKHVDQAENGELVDIRDWEILPDIGGSLPRLKDLLVLEKDLSAGWVKAWGRHVLAMNAFNEMSKLELEEVSDDSLLEGEKTLINGFAHLGQWLERAKEGSSEIDLKGIFDFAPSHPKDESSRWARIYHAHLSVETAKYVQIILSIIEELAKPSGTGKNRKKADPNLVEIVSKLKTLIAELSDRNNKIAESLEGLVKGDDAVDWKNLGNGYLEEDYVVGIGKEIVEARKGAVDRLQNLLRGRK